MIAGVVAAGYQVMPRLTPDEYEELEQSIREHGVQVPITVGSDGTIIDGHHRDEIARKHDLHCPRVTAKGDAATLRGLAFSLNLHRRHLSREQKRQIVAESIKADPQLSNREHARRTGVSDKTAGAVRSDLEESAEIPHFSERIDPRTGNASQPASKPRPTPEPSPLPPGFNPGDLDELNQPAPAPAPEPAAPKRKPLEDQFFHAVERLNSVIVTLTNLGDDDRLPRNKEKVARYRNDLHLAVEALQRLDNHLA